MATTLRFTEQAIAGVFCVDISPFVDERGSFGRVFCRREFADAGLPIDFEQMNLSTNPRRATLRGAHYQLPPHQEGKLIRAQKGAIFDVAIDLRPDSPTFGQWYGQVLQAQRGTMLYVPPGCAHAFLTLEDETEVFYMATHAYVPGVERGVRFDDPFFAIAWPLAPTVISDKDRKWPDFNRLEHLQDWARARRAAA